MEEKNKEVEIDLLELARKLWDNKKFIIKVTLIGAIIGLVIAFSIPKEYTSTVVFLANTNEPRIGSVGALASLAGINIDGAQSTDIFSPELYPYIVESTPFLQNLLEVNVKDEVMRVDTTLYVYLKNNQKNVWWEYVYCIPSILVDLFKSKEDGVFSASTSNTISKENASIISKFKKSFLIKTDKKTGLTTIEVMLQSPLVSAQLADSMTSHLQLYIIDERTKKVKKDLDNARNLYNNSKEEYNRVQKKLASFVDANQNLILAKYRIKQEELQNEVNLAYSLYNQMAQQVQLYEVKMQDDTPVFTIIQPSIVPLSASAPNKKLIVFFSVFITFFLASCWVIFKNYKEEFVFYIGGK